MYFMPGKLNPQLMLRQYRRKHQEEGVVFRRFLLFILQVYAIRGLRG